MKHTLHGITILTVIMSVLVLLAHEGLDIQKWEINQNEVVQLYIQKAPYSRYTLNQLQGYSNKLLNYILAIDANYKSKIIILRITGTAVRDYMFIDNKLYVVTDYLQQPTEGIVTGAIAQLEKKYGKPQKQSEGTTTTYTFTSDDTKIIAIYESKGKRATLTIYYYYKNLFRSLMQ